jgi:purine nucleoside permease
MWQEILFFHGPGLSEEAQYISKLYGADDYMITEMEGVAIVQVLSRTLGIARMMTLRGAVNFDQGNPNETTLEHLDPAVYPRGNGRWFCRSGRKYRVSWQ